MRNFDKPSSQADFDQLGIRLMTAPEVGAVALTQFGLKHGEHKSEIDYLAQERTEPEDSGNAD